MKEDTIPTVRIAGIKIEKTGFIICEKCCDVTDYDKGYVWDDANFAWNCFYCGRIHEAK